MLWICSIKIGIVRYTIDDLCVIEFHFILGITRLAQYKKYVHFFVCNVCNNRCIYLCTVGRGNCLGQCVY